MSKPKRQRLVKHTVSIDEAGCRQVAEGLASALANLAPLASVWPHLDRAKRTAVLTQCPDLQALATACRTFTETFHADV